MFKNFSIRHANKYMGIQENYIIKIKIDQILLHLNFKNYVQVSNLIF